jgi:hypothetical protein
MGYYTVTIKIEDEDLEFPSAKISKMDMRYFISSTICNTWQGPIKVFDGDIDDEETDYVGLRSYTIDTTRTD